MVTFTVKVVCYIPQATSLKEKRQVAKSIIDKVRHRFNASIAEVDTQDILQTLTLGVAVVSEGHFFAQRMMEQILRFTEQHIDAEILSIERDY